MKRPYAVLYVLSPAIMLLLAMKIDGQSLSNEDLALLLPNYLILAAPQLIWWLTARVTQPPACYWHAVSIAALISLLSGLVLSYVVIWPLYWLVSAVSMSVTYVGWSLYQAYRTDGA